MKKTALFFFILCAINNYSFAQDDLTTTLNLMPWPKEIKETSGKFIINSNLTVSVNGENNDRIRNNTITFSQICLMKNNFINFI